jgi:chromate transporter
LAAGLLSIIPGTLVILALSTVYALFGNQPVTTALFLGVKAAVVIIVLEALLRISRRALRHGENWVVAELAYIVILVFAVPFPLIVVCAALYGVAVTSAGHAPKADDVYILCSRWLFRRYICFLIGSGVVCKLRETKIFGELGQAFGIVHYRW